MGILSKLFGINNWRVQRAMKREAKRIAEWASKTYPVVKAKNPEYTETEVFQKMFSERGYDISKASNGLLNHIQNCCISIEGLCYMIAMDAEVLAGFMVFRCLQFTRYMDDELYARGFKPQSKDTKEAVLEKLDLLVDGWEKWC